MSYATRYQAAKRQQANARAESPDAVAFRLRQRAAAAAAISAREAAFPVLTPENVGDALAFQEAELRRLLDNPEGAP